MIIRDNNYKSCTDGATHGAPERISPTPRRGPQLGLRPQRRGEEQRGGTAAAQAAVLPAAAGPQPPAGENAALPNIVNHR